MALSVFETAWTQAWADLGREPPPGLHGALLSAYQAPDRHYHTAQHLAECLAHFEAARHLAERPGEVALALWFHDAVYDVRGSANEALSARWARAALQDSGADAATAQRIERLILATRHDAAPQAGDEQLLVDIDLAILGAPPERFAEYDRQVRAEYHWVPGLVYRVKRRAVLRAFLARPVIYGTEHFRTRLEQPARRNLASVV